MAEEKFELELLLNKATSPALHDDDWDSIAAFCDQVNKEIDGPQLAVRLLAHKIQSPTEREALSALSTLEACVKNCGIPFHKEIGKFRFLNDIIKVLSPKFLGSRTTERVKKRCTELMYSWSKGLPHETKIAEAYKMLKDQRIFKDDPTYMDKTFDLFPAPKPRRADFEDEERAKELARLLKSKKSNDLHAANKLIKELVKEDAEKSEKRSRRITELQSMRTYSKLLMDMLEKDSPSGEEMETMKELYTSLEKERPKLFKLAGETEEQEKDAMSDDNFQRMKASITAGRGRPPKLQQQTLTYKLLLQFELLRIECQQSWDDIQNFVPKIVNMDQPSLQGLHLKTEIEAVLKKGERLSEDGQEIDDFLSVDVEKCMLQRNIGPYLAECSIYRPHLLNPETLKTLTPPTEISNGLIHDLVVFLRAEGLPMIGEKSKAILEFLGLSLGDMTDRQLRTKINKVMDTHTHLRKNSHREKGKQEMKIFLSSAAFSSAVNISNRRSLATQPENINFPTDAALKLSQSERKAATLRRQLEDVQSKLNEQQAKNTVLCEQLMGKKTKIDQLEERLSQAQQINAELEENNGRLQEDKRCGQQQLQQVKQTLKQVRQTNFYKRMKRKERALNQREADLQAHMVGNCKKKHRQLKHRIKLLHTQISNQKKKMQSLQEKADVKTAQLQQQIADLMVQPDPLAIQIRKENSNEFTDNVKKTTIALIAAQVSTQNCPKVIGIVSKHLFGVEINEKDLPSERTVRRYSDIGHVLAKVQVAEAIEGANFDLHVDGTSREKTKYVGQQVTTADGSLSCGFSVVASENAATLVETTVSLLQELSELFPDAAEERDAHFKRMCSNLKGIMSDRAAVMKKYKKDMNELLQTTLGTEESVEFLYCNAHFLLGLSSKANTCLKTTQRELQEERIGRDQQPQYATFSTPEAAAVRYIRMACEVLGPRGDQKSGCRDSWMAYCSMTGRQSVISSFKENRFNNLFQAAAALHYHRPDIIRFFTEFLPDRNSKLTSVLFDAESSEVAVYVLSLAMVYLRITGPYWRLLACKTHYLDFYLYVVEMRTQLEEWKTDASTIFDTLPGLFGKPVPSDGVLHAALSASIEMKLKASLIFQNLCESFITVIDTQLSDFLPNGTYYSVHDAALRQKLSHSVITNMIGEACFGDLDLSIYKRRNSSCHHHTSVTMMMRNRMMEKWFSAKPMDDQTQLLQLSAKKAGALRKKHRQEERDAVAQRRLELEANQERRENHKAALARKKDNIIRKLLQQAGPCRAPGDVDRLLRRLKQKGQQKAALKVEMDYHKVVLGVKSPLLRTTQPVDSLAANLKSFLEQTQAVPVPRDLLYHDADNAPFGAGVGEPLPDNPPHEAVQHAHGHSTVADEILSVNDMVTKAMLSYMRKSEGTVKNGEAEGAIRDSSLLDLGLEARAQQTQTSSEQASGASAMLQSEFQNFGLVDSPPAAAPYSNLGTLFTPSQQPQQQQQNQAGRISLVQAAMGAPGASSRFPAQTTILPERGAPPPTSSTVLGPHSTTSVMPSGSVPAQPQYHAAAQFFNASLLEPSVFSASTSAPSATTTTTSSSSAGAAASSTMADIDALGQSLLEKNRTKDFVRPPIGPPPKLTMSQMAAAKQTAAPPASSEQQQQQPPQQVAPAQPVSMLDLPLEPSPAVTCVQQNSVPVSLDVNGVHGFVQSSASDSSVSAALVSTALPSPSQLDMMPLTDMTVPLESITPAEDVVPLTVYDKNGLKSLIHFSTNRPRSDILVMVLSTLSTNTKPVKSFVFQAAVPKVMKVKLQPPSASALPAFNPIVPPTAITQILLIANPRKEKIRLKFKVSYTLGEEAVSDGGDLEDFPVQ